jgi:citrate lyase subunit beta/citryl-CoA lyase
MTGQPTGKEAARPLRSVLFTPGDQPDQLERALGSGADSIVIDLEEPRTPFPEPAREEARAGVRAFLDRVPADHDRPVLFARVQPPASGQTLKDLRAVMGRRLTGVLVPKVQGPADIHGADALLAAMEVEHDVPLGSTAIYPVLETAAAIRGAYEIAVASPRVAYLGGAVSRFGDIHQALGYRWTAEGRETLFLRSKVLVDARAAGIRYPISGMWGGGRDDLDGLRAWATQLRELGYFGMMLGDAAHLAVVHEVFTPTDAEIAYWRDLDRLASEAEANGSGRITYGDASAGEGHVVHIAHVGSARQNLRWARELGVAP